jgi:hypothetical protein
MQLSQLHSLEELCLDLEGNDVQFGPVTIELVSQMSALTKLQLSVSTPVGFSSLRNCLKLQRLELAGLPDVSFSLSAADWEVVGQLTQLTTLSLLPVTQHADCEAFQSSLQQLTALRSLAAGAWAPEVLPALHGLPHLTLIGGGWLRLESSDSPGTEVTCSQVKDLWCTFDNIPSSAFRNLIDIVLCDCIPSAAMIALSRQCSHLQNFWNGPIVALVSQEPTSPSRTLPPAEPAADRVAAVRCLANLHDLEVLDVSVTDSAEMLAVAQTASVLARHKLKALRVVVDETCTVSTTS